MSMIQPDMDPQRIMCPVASPAAMCVGKKHLLLWKVPKAPKSYFGALGWGKMLQLSKVHPILGKAEPVDWSTQSWFPAERMAVKEG